RVGVRRLGHAPRPGRDERHEHPLLRTAELHPRARPHGAAVHAPGDGAALASLHPRSRTSSMTAHLSPRRCSTTTLAALLIVLASGSAHARSGVSPEGRAILGPDGPRPPAPAAPTSGAAGEAFARHAHAALAVPLPRAPWRSIPPGTTCRTWARSATASR